MTHLSRLLPALVFVASMSVADAAPSPSQKFPAPSAVQLEGVLGRALDANRTGHFAHFITDEKSELIVLFSPDHVRRNEEGDWYGEHAGKWLYAASRAANRSHDAALTARVRRVADYLVGLQDAEGYLGTYPAERRFPNRAALGKRTWDIWVHSYLILGLLETNKYFPDPRYLQAARRIGDLCWRTLSAGGINITDLGNHHGLSSTVLLDPAVELYLATKEKRYLDLANLILDEANQHAGLELLPRALAGADASQLGDGKAYQLCWNIVCLAKLHRATGDARYLQAAQKVWEGIRQAHLTPGGGPWGGVGDKSLEVFNPATFFSPYGYVETCSTFSWIQLNRELLAITGDARYAEEIEKSAYNDLLGAQAPDGDGWCYYSYANGKRLHTTEWSCCKSSGPAALEELPPIAYGVTDAGDLVLNLYGPGRAVLATPRAGTVALRQETGYPFDGTIRLTVQPERPARFTVFVRIPSWAGQSVVRVNDSAPIAGATAGTYLALEREWRAGDGILLQFPLTPRLQSRFDNSLQEVKPQDGGVPSEKAMRYDYVAISRGPLVYATALIDGFKREETLRLPRDRSALLEVLEPPAGHEGPAIRLNLGYRPPITFLPAYEAGGRQDGDWHLTWMQIAEP